MAVNLIAMVDDKDSATQFQTGNAVKILVPVKRADIGLVGDLI